MIYNLCKFKITNLKSTKKKQIYLNNINAERLQLERAK
jgi:hypothetical protein